MTHLNGTDESSTEKSTEPVFVKVRPSFLNIWSIAIIPAGLLLAFLIFRGVIEPFGHDEMGIGQLLLSICTVFGTFLMGSILAIIAGFRNENRVWLSATALLLNLSPIIICILFFIARS